MQANSKHARKQSSERTNRQAGRNAGRQVGKHASRQASKPANTQAANQLSKQIEANQPSVNNANHPKDASKTPSVRQRCRKTCPRNPKGFQTRPKGCPRPPRDGQGATNTPRGTPRGLTLATDCGLLLLALAPSCDVGLWPGTGALGSAQEGVGIVWKRFWNDWEGCRPFGGGVRGGVALHSMCLAQASLELDVPRLGKSCCKRWVNSQKHKPTFGNTRKKLILHCKINIFSGFPNVGLCFCESTHHLPEERVNEDKNLTSTVFRKGVWVRWVGWVASAG